MKIDLSTFQGAKPLGINDLKPGDIFASTTQGNISNVIRTLMQLSVSHTSVYVGDKQIVEAEGGGVQYTSIYEAYRANDFMIVFRHKKYELYKGMEICNYAKNQVGCAYNVRGAATMGIHTIKANAFGEKFATVSDTLSWVTNATNPSALMLNGVLDSIQVYKTLTSGKGISCSPTYCTQLVADAYKKAGLPLGGKPTHMIHPQDILLLSGTVLECLGFLKLDSW